MTSRMAAMEREVGKRSVAFSTLESMAEEGLQITVEIDLGQRCARICIRSGPEARALPRLDLKVERRSLREAIHAAEQEVRRSWASQGPRPREEEQP